MDKLFFGSGLGNLVKIKHDKVKIDNYAFRLHYEVTVTILLVFSLMISATQFFGEPISCIQKDDISVKTLNTFCWIESTFTLPKTFNKKVGVEVAHPGVAKHEPGDEVKEHAYYQWVCFVTFLQALLFYVPRFMWRGFEEGKVKDMSLELSKPILSEKERNRNIMKLVTYFTTRKGKHCNYAWKYILCELLNFVNVISQIYLVDRFLGYEFTTFGSDVVRFTGTDPENRLDPMVRVFPRVTKCDFYRYGSSGDVQKHDALCLIPLNILNEKIYVFMWFWFVVLAVLSGLALVYRTMVFFSPRIRYHLIFLLDRITPPQRLNAVLNRMSYGDWFLLQQVGHNIESRNFRDLLTELEREMASSSALMKEYNPQDLVDINT
ncbi:innexin inx2-like [Limulus polyphemus]|uniref:Innexin n=1 Tax=Limulus polyphemus TaxID=6850 RepID=A0ABM1BRZ7_LIMPO|nr:innexin inx2-like [Limulus polyphemus]